MISKTSLVARAGALALALLASPALAQVVPATPPARTVESYLDRLAALRTHLVRHGPAPQAYRSERPPSGVLEVVYPSGSLALKAWVAFPEAKRAGTKVPAVVFFHGGYAFGAGDFEDARPFLAAGFAVMCPTLRGENGNPGDFEMQLGEVDDAQAAVAWMAAQPGVEAARIYTFGHSAGGVVSALLSLRETAIRHGASSGGLYGPRMFDFDWARKGMPFADRPQERELRVLVGNVRWMKRRHFAYVGTGDAGQDVAAATQELRGGSLLSIIPIAGDHFTSLAPSVKAYIDRIKSDP